jgi:hypothetical protein
MIRKIQKSRYNILMGYKSLAKDWPFDQGVRVIQIVLSDYLFDPSLSKSKPKKVPSFKKMFGCCSFFGVQLFHGLHFSKQIRRQKTLVIKFVAYFFLHPLNNGARPLGILFTCLAWAWQMLLAGLRVYSQSRSFEGSFTKIQYYSSAH